ncbi:MAG: hypothetical protein IJW82_07405 [Clostridia bacterium]|nr:hypothetical protein [Clostridia bacterium]
MNNRYDELNKKIVEWIKTGTQDRLLLQTLYSQCNLEHHDMLDGMPDIRDNTKFSALNNEQLVACFSQYFFNGYSKEDLTHLMQEVHNRYIGEHGWDVSRSVCVEYGGPEDEGTFGYCCYADDLLFINKDMIDDAKSISNEAESVNEQTVGKYFLDTVWHETKHIIQYEDSIDLALGKTQDPETAFSAAAMIVMMTNFNIADSRGDNRYGDKWQDMYRFHFCEHEANYAALKKSEENTPDALKESYDYQMYASDSAALALGFYPSTTNQSKNLSAAGARVNRIENYLKSQIDYFKKGLKDCPLKQSVLTVLNEYMKEDEHGHSQFRDRLRAEVLEMIDTYVVNKSKLEEMEMQNEQEKGKTLVLKPKSRRGLHFKAEETLEML